MYPFPNCNECGEPMPWVAGSKKVDIHLCTSCERLAIVPKDGGKMKWFIQILTLKELLRRFPHLLRFKLLQKEVTGDSTKCPGLQERR